MPLTAVHGLDLDVAQLDVQGALVVTSGLSPVEKKRAKVLLEDPSLTLIIEEDKDDLRKMVAELLLGHPGRDLPELLQAHSDVLHVEEEEAALQLCSAGQHEEEVLEGSEGDAACLGGPDLLDPLEHPRLLGWRHLGLLQQELAEVLLGDPPRLLLVVLVKLHVDDFLQDVGLQLLELLLGAPC